MSEPKEASIIVTSEVKKKLFYSVIPINFADKMSGKITIKAAYPRGLVVPGYYKENTILNSVNQFMHDNFWNWLFQHETKNLAVQNVLNTDEAKKISRIAFQL